jgi:[ribosomal protein S18]-alanine N-acetyltransferase
MIRPYASADFDVLIQLLRLNTPAYFGEEEEAHFATFLKSDPVGFFVIERRGIVVGCAGYSYQAATQTGQVSWFVFHPDYQRQGLGKEILNFCLACLREKAPETIIVRTSQLVEGFFAQAGFVTTLIDEDYWAPGYDLYLMELK